MENGYFLFSSRGRKMGKMRKDGCQVAQEEERKGRREEGETRFESCNPWVERGRRRRGESGHTHREAGKLSFFFFCTLPPYSNEKKVTIGQDGWMRATTQIHYICTHTHTHTQPAAKKIQKVARKSTNCNGVFYFCVDGSSSNSSSSRLLS